MSGHTGNPSHPEQEAKPPGQRYCPVCWNTFTPNHPSNPHPRRYCSAACRIEEWRRQREAEQLYLDAKLEVIRARNRADAQWREPAQRVRELDRRRAPMTPD